MKPTKKAQRPLNYPWLRLYSDMLNNPKVQQLPAETFKGWVNLLALANAGDPRGALPSEEEIAFRLRMSSAGDVRGLLRDLERGKLLVRDEEGRLWPHGWDVWQADSDLSTARVRNHRELKSATQKEPSWKTEAFERCFGSFPAKKRAGKSEAFAGFCETVQQPDDVPILESTLGRYLNDHQAPGEGKFIMSPSRFFAEWRGMVPTGSDREQERAQLLRRAL